MSSLTQLRGRIAAIGGAIVFLLVAGVWITLTHASAQPSAAGGNPQADPSTSRSSQVPSGPLQLLSETPGAGARGVTGTTAIKIQFSAPLAADSPLPTIKPSVAGSWQGTGTSTLEFVPTNGFHQHTRVTVTIPGGPLGVRSARGSLLGTSVKVHFRIGTYQTARLDQLLAQLGYLPLTWTASAGATVPAATDTAGQLAAAYNPPAGLVQLAARVPERAPEVLAARCA